VKKDFRAGTLLYPLPAVIVTVGKDESEYNMLTVSWTGTICSDPAMCYISVRPERHTYPVLKKNMEFVINLTTQDMAFATDWVGVRSGKNFNKFKEMKLTPAKAHIVGAPYIDESPLCIECRVKEIIALGTHDMFIADVVNILVDDKFIDPETGAFDLGKAGLLVYVNGKYHGIGDLIGKFGWSVKKNKNAK